ncbi:hypothetical protein C8R47DRAFT_1100046 [Mycena vitilis]|nr:hypothetical protein C8R47DRAFT_1100046 [Mycena vitilis]
MSEVRSRCSGSCFQVTVSDSQPPEESPCPGLLLDNVPPPDFRIHEIKNAIESAEDDISGLDVQIAGLNRSLSQLISRRAELERFVNDHRGVISIVRRLPGDVLAEIFSHCVDAGAAVHPPQTRDALRRIVQVSGNWRAIAVGSPHLWRHLFIPQAQIDDGTFKRRIPLQLQQSRQAPVHILMYAAETQNNQADVALNLLLPASARWEELALSLRTPHYRQLLASTCDFPALKKLTILSWDTLEWHNDDVLHFFGCLPVLEELELDTLHSFTHLPFPWSQLRRCVLKRCHPADLLRILPLLSPGAHLSGVQSGMPPEEAPPGNVRSTVHALKLHGYTDSCTTVLNSLTAPALKELELSSYSHERLDPNHDSPSTLAPPAIISFLSRSACALTSLCLSLPLRAEDFIAILDSPHTRSVVHLDISNKMSLQWIEVLTSRGLVPNLRALGFRADPTLTEASVLTMVASRRPVLRVLRIASPKPRSVLSHAAVQALGADGMELFLSQL